MRSIFERLRSRSHVRMFAGDVVRARGSSSRVDSWIGLTLRHVVGRQRSVRREVDRGCPASVHQCRFEHCRVRVADILRILGCYRKPPQSVPVVAVSLLQRTFRVGAVHLKPPKFYEERSMSINSGLSLSNSDSSKKPIMPSLISSNW